MIICGSDGNPVKWKKGESCHAGETYELCRCGKSGNKPFCDGSHSGGFNGKETASMKSYDEQAAEIRGPNLILKDAQELCAAGRFCHRGGGTWDLTERSDDPKAKKLAIQEACDCPSGRLVACDKKTGNAIEPDLKPSIGIVEDPGAGVSGPIRLKGGIPLESADGKEYEVRNRMTLCRCGKSRNKPFCDGTHISVKFKDGDKSLKK